MTGQKAHHVPQPTPRFAIDAGGYYGTRNLNYEADGETAAVQREGQGPAARRRGLSVSAAEARRRSPASASSSRCSIRSPAPSAATPRTRSATPVQPPRLGSAVGWRQPLGVVTLSGRAGYGQEEYALSTDFPLEVPDCQYKFLYAGGGVDLNITERASLGFGAKYFYVTEIGDQADVMNWYGPGETGGFGLDGHFSIPLPSKLFVRGELAYRRFETVLDGAGLITEQETVLSGVDNTFNVKLNLGVTF